MNSVVVTCLDSVRKDYFDEHAERVQALSDSSVDQCPAASTWSLPSHASMRTGQLPSTHGRPVPGVLDDGASAIVRASRRAVRECSEPVFLFTNFMDVHLPHRNLLAYDADVPYRWSSEDLDRHEMNKAERTR